MSMRDALRHAFLFFTEVIEMMLEFLQAGEIVTTHGVRGEFKVLPWCDSPEFLLPFRRVMIDKRVFEVEKCRVQKSCNLLKIKGIDTVEAAQALRGKIIEIFRADAPADAIFAAELIGAQVFEGDNLLGTISDVLDYPGNKVYVVSGEYEYMIPAVKEFILSVQLAENKIFVKTLEGMRTDES